MCTLAVIYPGVGVDPNLNLRTAGGRAWEHSRFRRRGLRAGRGRRQRLLRACCPRSQKRKQEDAENSRLHQSTRSGVECAVLQHLSGSISEAEISTGTRFPQ